MRRRNILGLTIAWAAVTPLEYIRRAAEHSGVSYEWLRRTASCETGGTFNPNARSKNGLYHGMYQYSWNTWNWMSVQAGWAGYSPYDPEAAAYVTAWAFSHGYRNHWPRCSYA